MNGSSGIPRWLNSNTVNKSGAVSPWSGGTDVRITQISLVRARRVELHRRLGLLGFVLATVMIVLGTATADRLARHVAQPGTDTVEEVRGFYAVPLGDMLMFSTFVYLGYSQPFPTGSAQAADVVRYALASGRRFRPLAGL